MEVLERLPRCQMKAKTVENLKVASEPLDPQLLLTANKILGDLPEVAFG